jgi:cation transport ATPase
MGRSGTEAAREASDVVLTDDDFSTIVAAIREGRRIGDNLLTFLAFLLSANAGEVVLFAVAVLAGLGAPMTVVQVLAVTCSPMGCRRSPWHAILLRMTPCDVRRRTWALCSGES